MLSKGCSGGLGDYNFWWRKIGMGIGRLIIMITFLLWMAHFCPNLTQILKIWIFSNFGQIFVKFKPKFLVKIKKNLKFLPNFCAIYWKFSNFWSKISQNFKILQFTKFEIFEKFEAFGEIVVDLSVFKMLAHW